MTKKRALGNRVPVECHDMLNELVEQFTTPVSKASKEMILELAIRELYKQYTGRDKPKTVGSIGDRYGIT